MTKEKTIEVLNAAMEYSKLRSAEFSRSIGKSSPQWVYDYLNPDKSVCMSLNTANLIKKAYPEFNINYLLTGEGSLLDTEQVKNNSTEDVNTVYLLPVSAQGGSLTDFESSVMQYECEKIMSPVKGATLAITVKGSSMSPEYPDGSIVFLKRVDESVYIEWGKVYVLATRNGNVIKRIAKSNKEDYVQCVSTNSDPLYTPFEVSRKDIFAFYQVLACLSMK